MPDGRAGGSAGNYCLLLGADQRWRDRALPGAIRAAAGHPVALMQARAPVERNRAADLVVPGNPFEPGEALAAVAGFEERTGRRPMAVVPLVEMAVQPGLAIAQHFGLPYMSPEAVAAARDKTLMKERFRAAGLPVPGFAAFSTWEELKRLMGGFSFPVVIKPAHFGGSEGVSLARDPDELRQAYERVVSSMRGLAGRFGLSETAFQVEEYIDSDQEVSVEVLNTPQESRVLAVTDKFLTPAPFFAETGHAVPSIRSGDPSVAGTALAACAAIGLRRGLAHVEMRLRPDGAPVLIEVNARPAGGGILDLVERVTGVNTFEHHVRSFIGDGATAAGRVEARGRAAIAFLKAPVGRIVGVNAPEPGNLPPEVTAVHLWARAGDLSRPASDSNHREGAVEFHWPDDEAGLPLECHLAFAAELCTRLIEVEGEAGADSPAAMRP
jgi:predicted ATP-grasp superfamily ATP-dependent carboligase